MGRLQGIFRGLIVLTAMSALPAYAVEGSGISFGGMIGSSTYNSGGATTKNWSAGARWEFLPWKNCWGLGLEWTIMPNLPVPGSPGKTFNLMTTAVDFDYRKEVGSFVFYGGPKLGAGIGEMADKKGAGFGGGALVAIDFFFLPQISVGAVAEFVSLTSMTVNQVPISSGTLLEGFGVLKIWL